MGRVDEQDVNTEPTLPLREVMAAAAERDAVAAQFVENYRSVGTAVRTLEALTTGGRKNLEFVTVTCFLTLLAAAPDSLIARKCGSDVAAEVSRRASDVGWPGHVAYAERVAAFDAWLRADGHRRNPGTTADLLTASLFVALRRGIISFPLTTPFANDRSLQ
jgi:triphosphoribosyl-dephospho-CoA synthase